MAEAFLSSLAEETICKQFKFRYLQTAQFYGLFQKLLKNELNITLWANGHMSLGRKKDDPRISADDLFLFCYAFIFFTFYEDIMLFGFVSDLEAWNALVSFMEVMFDSVHYSAYAADSAYSDIQDAYADALKFFQNSIFNHGDFFSSLFPVHGTEINEPLACKSIIQFCRATVHETEKEIRRAAKEQAAKVITEKGNKSIIQICRAKETEKEIRRAAKEHAKEQAAKAITENGNAYYGIWFSWNNYLCAIMVSKYFFN